MGSQLIVRMDPKTKKRFYELARMEGKTASAKVREMVESYISTADVSLVVDDLWDRIGIKMRAAKTTQADVAAAVEAFRRSR